MKNWFAISTSNSGHNFSEESPTPKLSRNYETNDIMLHYNWINEYFSIDTVIATKKVGKSSRGHTRCQLFITNKGFLHVISMKSKADVLQALQQFAKETRAPDVIICDASGEQTKKEVKQFLSKAGISLKILEEGTPWLNKAELYIGLMKEAVPYMKSSYCPLPFCYYFIERRAHINNMTAKELLCLDGSNAFTNLTGEQRISPIYVPMIGMNGVTFVTKKKDSLYHEKFWVEFWGLRRTKVMKWYSGYWKQMVM